MGWEDANSALVRRMVRQIARRLLEEDGDDAYLAYIQQLRDEESVLLRGGSDHAAEEAAAGGRRRGRRDVGEGG